MIEEERAEREHLMRRVAAHSEAVEAAALPEATSSLLKTDLTVQQLKVLTLLLAQTQDPAIGDLAEALGVSRASMTTMVDRLVATGTVTRDVDDTDHRVRHIHVTDAGRTLVQRLVGARPEFAAQVLSRLATDDLRALERGVGALARAMGAEVWPDVSRVDS